MRARAGGDVGFALAGHRYMTEHALAALRIDHTLDDREKARRVTQLVEQANARAVELMRQRRRLAALGLRLVLPGEPASAPSGPHPAARPLAGPRSRPARGATIEAGRSHVTELQE